MNKLFLFGVTMIVSGLIMIGLSGCLNESQTSENLGNGFEVEYLFEKDGIKVYRFRDGGRTHYFTSNGETITNKKSGKTTVQENIQ